MNPEEIVDVFVAGIILVIGVFVIASISMPSVANILDNFLVQIISILVYSMVIIVGGLVFYQLFQDI